MVTAFQVEKIYYYTLIFNRGRKNTGLPLKSKDLLYMILFLNEEATYTSKGFERIYKEEADSVRFHAENAGPDRRHSSR